MLRHIDDSSDIDNSSDQRLQFLLKMFFCHRNNDEEEKNGASRIVRFVSGRSKADVEIKRAFELVAEGSDNMEWDVRNQKDASE
ncbi:hypothetical protein AVEN_23522-1 [Araneus ventricosus]|uniref:Uncharacterized protein n=1 Tax=Araneus ventricosus TaxID=182803 RepID=A0A4Y2GZS6_ARAVE|nr:hypothetical protein AVEN_23522-1 [Araneus ventricosus]